MSDAVTGTTNDSTSGRIALSPLPQPSIGSSTWIPNTFRSLRHRNYRLYFIGQLLSLTGSWLQITALMGLAYQLTGLSLWPASIQAAHLIPTLILGAWGGTLADRYSKRQLIGLCQWLLLTCTLFLASADGLGYSTPWLLLGLASVTGIIGAVELPARMSFVVEMVGREDLINAVALNSLLFNVARFGGAALAALLVPLLGTWLCFLLNGLSFVAVLIALALMDPSQLRAPKYELRQQATILAGFRFLGNHSGMRLLLVLAGLTSFFGWPILSLLPAVAVKRLGLGPHDYGQLLSCLGLGALVASLLVATFATPGRQPLLLGLGLLGAATGLANLAWVNDLWLGQVFCTLIGCGLILFFATSQGVFQLGARDDNRGVLMGIWSMILSGANPFGNLITGPLADAWDVSIALLFQSAGILISGSIVGLSLAVRSRQSRSPLPDSDRNS